MTDTATSSSTACSSWAPGRSSRTRTWSATSISFCERAARTHLKVVLAPFAVALADDTEVQPDLLVAARTQFTRKELPGPPLLAVEVLSPSTRRIDLLLKRDRLQEAGVPSYWLVDPEEPSVTVLELHGGVYVERARSVGSEPITVAAPYALTIVAVDLRDD